MRLGMKWTGKGIGGEAFTSLFFLLTALLPSLCIAQTGEIKVLTVKEAVEMALKSHPAIEEQRGKVHYQDGKTGETQGAYYPKLYIGGDYSKIKPVGGESASTVSVGGLPSGGSIPAVSRNATTYEQYATAASMSQRFFDFGQTQAQVGAQKLVARAARHDLQNVRQQVVLYVKQTYFKLLGAQSARTVRAEAVGQYEKHLEYAKALYKVGSKPRLDVLKADVDLSNARVELIKAENEVRLQTANLSNATGMPDNLIYSVEESPPAEWVEQPLDEALRIAFERRPDLLSAQEQRASAAEAVKAARLAHLPVVSGGASYYYAGTAFPLEHAWQAGANFVVPIFSGFVTSHQVAQAQGNYTSMLAREKSLKQNIILDLQQGYLSLREAAERMRNGEVAVRQAGESVVLANEQYRIGTARAVDVADAVAALAKARLDEISARYDYRIAQAMIEKAVGNTRE